MRTTAPPVSRFAPRGSIRSTTVVVVTKDGRVAMGGDGQVTMGDTVVKGAARKVRLIRDGRILTGFAGSVADAFTLFGKLEDMLERWPSNLPRACVELAKEWRTDRYLRRLEALLLVADRKHVFLVGGEGNVIEPDLPIAAIGSGGGFALAAARALYDMDLDAAAIARRSLQIASEICVYTNDDIRIIELDAA